MGAPAGGSASAAGGPTPEAIALDLGLEGLKHIAPKGLAWIATWWKGRRILVVGPKRAGKTSFCEYLQYGVLRQEQPTATTDDPLSSATFKVLLGRNESLELHVKRAIEEPGHYSATQLSKTVCKHKPHLLLTVLDASADQARWVEEFSSQLNSDLLAGKRTIRRSLKTIMVLLNKVDKVTDTRATTMISNYRQLFRANLKPVLGNGASQVRVRPSILVQNERAEPLLKDIITSIALALR